MKNLLWMVLLPVVLRVSGQTKKDISYLSTKDLIGVWERDSKQAGNGLEQNFRFFSDSTFEVDFTNSGEDARDISEIRGTYRVVKELLYLTIRVKVVTEGGKIAVTESSESGNIFDITGGARKEIPEHNPAELPEPILITVVNKGKIMLNNETYYKLTREDLKKEGIEGKF